MLNKILKVMLIIILLPIFATCGVITVGAGAGFMQGVSDGYEEANEATNGE